MSIFNMRSKRNTFEAALKKINIFENDPARFDWNNIQGGCRQLLDVINQRIKHHPSKSKSQPYLNEIKQACTIIDGVSYDEDLQKQENALKALKLLEKACDRASKAKFGIFTVGAVLDNKAVKSEFSRLNSETASAIRHLTDQYSAAQRATDAALEIGLGRTAERYYCHLSIVVLQLFKRTDFRKKVLTADLSSCTTDHKKLRAIQTLFKHLYGQRDNHLTPDQIKSAMENLGFERNSIDSGQTDTNTSMESVLTACQKSLNAIKSPNTNPSDAQKTTDADAAREMGLGRTPGTFYCHLSVVVLQLFELDDFRKKVLTADLSGYPNNHKELRALQTLFKHLSRQRENHLTPDQIKSEMENLGFNPTDTHGGQTDTGDSMRSVLTACKKSLNAVKYARDSAPYEKKPNEAIAKNPLNVTVFPEHNSLTRAVSDRCAELTNQSTLTFVLGFDGALILNIQMQPPSPDFFNSIATLDFSNDNVVGDFFNFKYKSKNDPIEKNRLKFDITGITVYSGASISQGHYFTYVKRGNTWTKKNDNNVTVGLNWDDIRTEVANDSHRLGTLVYKLR